MADEKRSEPDLQLKLLNQEARYESENAQNAILQSQLKALRKRIGALEKRYLDGQTANELRCMKQKLAHLQALTNREHEKLGGLKGMFRKLREVFRTQPFPR